MEKRIERPGCICVYDYWAGGDHPAVVLIHGYGIHRAMWAPQVAALRQAGYPVVNIDVRGHGASRPTESFSVVQAARDIHAILQAEDITRYIVCGLSMGAVVTQEYALGFGGALGYMLTGVTPLFAAYAKWEKTLMAWSGPMMRWLYTWKGLRAAMVKGSAHTQPGRELLAPLFDQMDKEEFLVSWAGFSTCLHEESYQFTAPLLVVAGEQDTRGTILKHLPDWKRLYPQCQVQTLPQAGHVANLDQPERFNAMLLDFIGRCAQPTSDKSSETPAAGRT